jgi:hypothetical protein
LISPSYGIFKIYQVFEIREYLDDEGNEVRSEVVSLDNAVKELEESELVDKFKEFAGKGSSSAEL